jgi:hypothetical protein
MSVVEKILNGSVSHVETRHVWVGKIKISSQDLLDWFSIFLNHHHNMFLNKTPKVLLCSIIHERGGQWWGPRVISLHVDGWGEDVQLGDRDGYLELFREFCVTRISFDLGVPVDISKESLLDALDMQLITNITELRDRCLEICFEIDLSKHPIKNIN